jgi:hypothetical protein
MLSVHLHWNSIASILVDGKASSVRIDFASLENAKRLCCNMEINLQLMPVSMAADTQH